MQSVVPLPLHQFGRSRPEPLQFLHCRRRNDMEVIAAGDGPPSQSALPGFATAGPVGLPRRSFRMSGTVRLRQAHFLALLRRDRLRRSLACPDEALIGRGRSAFAKRTSWLCYGGTDFAEVWLAQTKPTRDQVGEVWRPRLHPHVLYVGYAGRRSCGGS